MKNKKLTIWVSLVIFCSMLFLAQNSFAENVSKDEKLLAQAVLKIVLADKFYKSLGYTYISVNINKKLIIIDKNGKIIKINGNTYSGYSNFIYKNWARIEMNPLNKNFSSKDFIGAGFMGIFKYENNKWNKIWFNFSTDIRSWSQILLEDAKLDINTIPADVREKLGLD